MKLSSRVSKAGLSKHNKFQYLILGQKDAKIFKLSRWENNIPKPISIVKVLIPAVELNMDI